MLTKLEYNLTFSNEINITQSLTLGKGSTLITGKNGKGKSLNFEMVGFALFGTKALRGLATDYKRMKVELDIQITGKQFTIKRTKSKAEVFNAEGKAQASGTSATNAWVLRTLGYGYDVFRIAHWCAQGDIQALASMRPTERKQMIDSVAGLTQMDSLEKSLANDAKNLRTAIDSATKHLIKPVEPVAPAVPPMQDILSTTDYYQKTLEKWLRVCSTREPVAPVKPEAPVEPSLPPEPQYLKETLAKPVPPEVEQGLPGTVAQATQLEMELDRRVSEINQWESDYHRYEEQYAYVEELPDGLEGREQLISLWQNFERGERIKTLESQSQVTCPHCSGTFHLSDELAQLKQEPHSFTRPELTLSGWDEREAQLRINSERDRLKGQLENSNAEQLRDLLHKVRVLKAELIKFDGDQKQYAAQSEQVAKMNASNKMNWEAQVKNIKDHIAQQNERYEQALKSYEVNISKYQELLAEYQEALSIKTSLIEVFPENTEATIRSALEQLAVAKQTLLSYESAVERYKQDLEIYNQGMVGVQQQRDELEELGRARQALKEVKSTVQSHLLPSLNKVASSLMNEMTGGEFQSVEVGQDFEVMVDGQPMRTLSGSGKDLANLTLRIGLGRILTHRVLPLMMLDEIDSAMDDTRASYTWECIERITPHIGQVLQASHKELDAQNRIEV